MAPGPNKLTPAHLLKEQSLFSIWWASNKIRLRRINWIFTAATVLVLCLSTGKSVEYSTIVTQVRSVADLGLTFAITILGFLIAGFTIFATLSRVEMFITMAHHTEPKTGLDYLKYNFFAFIGVFAEYLALTCVCVLVKLVAYPGGAAGQMLDYFDMPPQGRHCVARMALIGLSGGLVYAIMQLKSFLFNIYHLIMTSIAWVVEEQNDDAEASVATGISVAPGGHSSVLPLPNRDESN